MLMLFVRVLVFAGKYRAVVFCAFLHLARLLLQEKQSSVLSVQPRPGSAIPSRWLLVTSVAVSRNLTHLWL